MADRVLFIGWGAVARGHEEKALETFNEALGILGRKQQEGAIESFDVALLQPNAQLDGYIAVKGTADQINALRDDEEFQRNTIDAQLNVDGITHLVGYADQGVAEAMGIYQDAIARSEEHTSELQSRRDLVCRLLLEKK